MTTVLINRTNLDTVTAGFKTVFQEAFDRAESHFETVAMTVPSGTAREVYSWLGAFPKLREWLGDRVINNLSVSKLEIENRLFENTVAVRRTDIEDDKIGIFSPIMSEMGRDTKQFPDELVFGLLRDGFAALCYDGQYFFDPDHPVLDRTGEPQSVSNLQAGGGEPWFLFDLSRAVKPIVWQTRVAFDFQALTDPHDEHVFWRDEFVYGVRGRANAGFGLWQLAYGSKAPLTAANYETARQAMIAAKGDYGRKLNIRPTHLVVGSALEGDARRLLNRGTRVETVTVGAADQAIAVANEWADTAQLIVTSHLD